MSLDLAIIPVAGHGTRLLPLTKSQPKEMLPVGRKPVVQFVAEELVQAGIKRALFITGRGKASLEDHFQPHRDLTNLLRTTGKEEQLAELDFERAEIEYFYTRQREQLGLGHAVLTAYPLIGDQPVVVALGDSIIGINAKSQIMRKMIDLYEETKADAIVAFEEVPREDVVRYGIAKPKGTVTDDLFELEDLIEKPTIEEAPSTLAVAARYVFSPRIFEKLQITQPGKGGEIQLTDAIRLLLHDGGVGYGMKLPAGESRFDIGNFKSYYEAFMEFALADPDHGEALKEHLRKLL